MSAAALSSLSSPSPSSRQPAPSPPAPRVQRVQHNAPTMRRQQQRAAAPSNRAIRQQKPAVKLALAPPHQLLPSSQLSLADSLRALDLIAASELAAHYGALTSERADSRRKRKRRREAREEARPASQQQKPPQPESQQPEQRQEAGGESDERVALQEDIAQGQSASTQPERRAGVGVTLGLNAITRSLEACPPQAGTANSSPFSLLVLTSCLPPALTAHLAYYSHYLRLPLLTLHGAVTAQQLAHCLSPTLTSLLALALHRNHCTALLAALLPLASVLSVGWLDGQGGGYERMRISAVERSEERAAREEVKRKAREDAVRAARPLSPKSVAAAVFKQKQAEREAAEAAAAATQTIANPSTTANAGSMPDAAASKGD